MGVARTLHIISARHWKMTALPRLQVRIRFAVSKNNEKHSRSTPKSLIEISTPRRIWLKISVSVLNKIGFEK